MFFNSARAQAFDSFCKVLAKAKATPRMTEIEFHDAWLSDLQTLESLYASGWYDPPPSGISLLFSTSESPDRISFESLRQEKYWPTHHTVDWNGLLFAYSSCVCRKTGMMGDFDVTLYFGNDPKLKAHYRQCYWVTDKLLQSIHIDDTSRGIFLRSQKYFADLGLQNCVTSVTDVTALDLGHTFPSLAKDRLTKFPLLLTSDDKNTLRTSRKFLNDLTDWPLEEGTQFSLEPQLRSIADPSLPQISFHYLVHVQNGQVQICRDIDVLIRPCL